MSKFNICIIQPQGYVHSQAFLELAELLFFSLEELNHIVTIGYNSISNDSINILIGCHLLNTNYIKEIPKSTIILNTEQIAADNAPWNSNIFNWMSSFTSWDYSSSNIKKLKTIGIDTTKLLKIGYQKELNRIPKNLDKNIDILFYGCLNDRRSAVINALKLVGLKVETLFGIYGQERDRYISRSKVVLNHHFYDSQIFEVVRVFYLLTNKVAVAAEVSSTTNIEDWWISAVNGVPYEDLAEHCVNLVQNVELRYAYQNNGFDIISRYPQSTFTQQVL